MEATAELPDGTTRLADRDRRLGFPLAGRLSLRRAVRAAEGHDDLDALHLRQLGRQPAQSASAARARRLGTEHVGRDGRFLDPGDPARRRRRADPDRRLPPEGARGGSRRVHEAAAGRSGQPAAPRRGREPVSRWRAARRGDRRVPAVAAAQSATRRRRTTTSAFALSARGRRDEAIAAFQEALRIDPDYAQAHNNLGALLQLGGRADAALEHYRRAVALRPDNVEAHTNLGQLLSNRGRAAEAAAQFSEALALRGRQRPGARRAGLDPRDRRRIRRCATRPRPSGSPSAPTRPHVTRM